MSIGASFLSALSMFHRPMLDAELLLDKKPPPQPPVKPAADPKPAVAPAKAPDAQHETNPFGGVFKPGMPELGAKRYTVHEGDTPWKLVHDAGVLKDAYASAADRLVNAHLSGTPALDPRAFGTRPAQPADAPRHLQPGQQVTVLDAPRLKLLEQQRWELKALEDMPSASTDSQITHQQDLRNDLVTSIYQELDYAGTQQGVPDPQQLAATIRERAPADAAFTGAVDDAVALYKNTLAGQGRTADQFGVIEQKAAAQDFDGVRDATRDQLVRLCGNSQGSDALGRLTGRGSVYMTYAGGDPRLADAVKQGIKDAEHEVLVNRPVAEVEKAYRDGGANAAMKRLAEVTDPKTATPGQVGQIMSDARLQSVVKQTLHDVHEWHDARGGPGQLMQDLATACQHAVYSDGSTPGLGKQAVDQIATEMARLSAGPGAERGSSLMQSAFRLRQVFGDAAAQGNDALALAYAAQARAQGVPGMGSVALDGVRTGFHTLADHVKALNEETSEDAAFVAVPASEWGAASSPAEQSAAVQKLLAQNPDKAKKLAEDGQELLEMKERLESAHAGIEAYTPDLKGMEGFDTQISGYQSRDGYLWSGLDNKGVTESFGGIPKPQTMTADNGTPTNTLWFQRSLRKVVEIAGKGYISQLGKGGEPLLSPKGEAVVQNLWKRGNKTLGAMLYFQNAAYELGEFGEKARSGALVNGLVSGASGLRQELAGVSYALSAGIPADRLAGIRPGSGATPLANSYANWVDKIDQLAVSDGAKLTMKQGVRLVLQDTSDLASAVLGVISAGIAFSEGKPLEGVGQTLNAVGYGFMLTGAGIDEAVFIGDATLMGMGATAWTGIGAALVLAGSALYTGATAYSHSHQYDGASRQWLESIGVKPEIAEQMAKHATSFDGEAPTAGPFLSAYFAHNKLPQQKMVSWLNMLTPKQADEMASAIKSFGDEWKQHPMSENVRRFDDALLQYGLMPPDVQLVAAN